MRLQKLEAEQSASLLQNLTGIDVRDKAERSALAQLTEELGHLPLALEQAGAYIAERDMKFERYLLSFRSRRLQLLKDPSRNIAEYAHSVATTWSLDMLELREHFPGSAALLEACAFLHPTSIPEELLELGGSELGPPLADALGNVSSDPARLDDLLAPLLRFSLITRELKSATITVHRLVQEVIKDSLPELTHRFWAKRIGCALAKTFPSVEYQNWGRCGRLISHADAALSLIENWNLSFEQAGTLLDRVGVYLREQARYDESERFLSRALSIREKELSRDDPLVAQTLNNLGVLHDRRGEHEKSGPFYVRALEIREQVLGDRHPDVAQSLSDLAWFRSRRCEHDEARRLYARATSIWETTLGADDPMMAQILGNSAVLHDQAGALGAAESLYRRALAIRQKALGPEHPDVAQILNNLAVLHQNRREHAEAESLYRQALQIRETVFGTDHPLVEATLGNLASLCVKRRMLSEAADLYMRVLRIRERSHGFAHPSLEPILTQLSLLYQKLHRLGDAQPLYSRVLEIRRAQGDQGAWQVKRDPPESQTSLQSASSRKAPRGTKKPPKGEPGRPDPTDTPEREFELHGMKESMTDASALDESGKIPKRRT